MTDRYRCLPDTYRAAAVDNLTFQSKVDGWLRVVLLGSALVCLVAAGFVMLAGNIGTWLMAGVLATIGSVLPLWVLGDTRYTFTASALEVRSGPFRWRVPLSEIRAVAPTRNPLSSPALSLDRLRIDYGRRSIMVSPRDKNGFLRELETRRAA